MVARAEVWLRPARLAVLEAVEVMMEAREVLERRDKEIMVVVD